MPIITWVCEECRKQRQGGLRPPKGWCEVSFWNEKSQKFHRFSFCSYSCCSIWTGKRYETVEGNNV
jgi:hypothetical protein